MINNKKGVIATNQKRKKILDKITDDDDCWVCTCKNTCIGSGFFTCDEKGNQVEPTRGVWTTDCYVCFDCGNIIYFHTLEIVGKATQKTMEKNWRS